MAIRKQILDQDNNEILPITDTESVRNPQSVGGVLENRLVNLEDSVGDFIQRLPDDQFTEDNFASFDSSGGIKDSGKKASDFATLLVANSIEQLTSEQVEGLKVGDVVSAREFGTLTQEMVNFTVQSKSIESCRLESVSSAQVLEVSYTKENNLWMFENSTAMAFEDLADIDLSNLSGDGEARFDAKADKVSDATSGNFAGLDSNGNLTDSGKKASDFATASQGAKADTAVQQVTVGTTTTGAAGTDASVTNSGTATNPVLNFTIPRGANGQDGADAYNPFKGTYLITDTLPSTGQAGDYIYVVDTQTPPVTHLYTWNGTAFADTTETVTMGNAQFQNSTKQISQTNVVNDLTTGGTEDVLSAEAGKTLNEKAIVNVKTLDNKSDNIVFVDENNNILAIIDKNGIKTKNFDPASFSPKHSGTLTLLNSDIITVIGSSFGETSAFPTNKHWSGIMSMFSDYRIQNLSAGGSNIVTNLYRIRSGEWNIQGKYVAITNNENLDGLDLTQYMEGLDNLCTTLIGMGKIPIVCTNYHKSQYFSMAIKRYAYEHNLMFWDGSDYCNTLVSGIYGGFDDGAHLRKRNAPMLAYAYLNYMNQMGKPYSSIKIFNIRNSGFSGSLDDLVYSNNVERAKLFCELKISHSQTVDEYNRIISNYAVDFGKYGLIECTIPSTSNYVNKLKLNLDTNGKSIKVYIKNVLAEPYPNTNLSSVVRFSVSDSTISVPSIGDVYSYGGVNYTVQSVVMGENDYYCTIYCSPATMPSSQSGTLNVVSQVSGSVGSSSIAFVMAEETSLDLYSYISSDNKGHWVELTGENGSYSVPTTLFNGSIQVDKVSFLIMSNEVSNTFQIKDVSLDYDVDELKTVESNKDFVWCENDYISTNELIQESTFGVVGTTQSTWFDSNGNGVVSVADYENKYPAGATSEIVVSDVLSMNTTINSSVLDRHGNMWLEIYCRYFPDAPTPYTQANDTEVNDISYDFNELFIKFSQNSNGSGINTVILSEEVGLYWKIVRIPICWFRQVYNSAGNITNMYLSLYSNSKKIEICKVSLKYEQ